MKKIIKSLIVLLILTVFAVSGCGQKDTPTSSTEVGDSSPIAPSSQIVITCESEVIEIKDTDGYFRIDVVDERGKRANTQAYFLDEL